MKFKDSLNQILDMYVSDEGYAKVEKSLADDELFAIQVGYSAKYIAKVNEVSSQEILGSEYINVLSRELFWLVKNEFVNNTSSMKIAKGLSIEDRLRNALKSIDVDMICNEHDSITCKICFGKEYANVPAGRTAAEFRKANSEIHSCFYNSYGEREFLKERIHEIKTGSAVAAPLKLEQDLHIKDQYSVFVTSHNFEYDNKRGFKGMICVPEYIKSFVTGLYFNDDDFETKRLSLSIEIETLYSKLFSYWIEYTNKQRFIKKSSVQTLLENIIPNTRVQRMLEERKKPA